MYTYKDKYDYVIEYDRYGGVYSGAKYLVFNSNDCRLINNEFGDDDISARHFWEEESSKYIIGKSNNGIEEAIENYISLIDDSIKNNNKLYWAKVNPDAVIPTKKTENAGYDVYPCFEGDCQIILPHTTKLIPTGIACAVSEGYYLQVEERGSTGSKGIKKSAGVIDSGYRGEIFIAITNANNKPIVINKDVKEFPFDGDYIVYPYEKAIAQLIVHRVEIMDEEEISHAELLNIPSERGSGALGSSGK